MSEDLIQFASESDPVKKTNSYFSLPPWKLLIVDDDPEVHNVTKFVLHEQRIHGRPLNLIYADSALQAREQLTANPDVAVALLDVVMETDHAGLELVKHIREVMNLSECRLILRTGQPGYAPELAVIQDYDINDYRTKSELTHTRLITTVSAALRSYEQIHAIAEHRRGLELIVNSASDFLEQHAIADLAHGVLIQLAALLKLSPNGIVVTHRGKATIEDSLRTYVVGAAGKHALHIARPLETLPDLRIVSSIKECLDNRRHIFGNDYTVLYLQTSPGQDAAIFLDSIQPLAELDLKLLDVFVTNIASCFRNIKLVERLNYIAYHDQLTGLLNRQGFISNLDSIASSDNDNIVVLLDLDHFTDLNDGLGHDFGDSLLKSVSKRFDKLVGQGCSIARIGADVFGIIGPRTLITADNLMPLFHESFEVGEYQIPLNISLGMCSDTQNADSGLTLLKRSNIALNLSKKNSSVRHEFYLPDMEEKIRQRINVIRDLRHAFAADRLQVWYQPQVSFTTGEVTGLEALIRWPEGNGFAYPPSVFIPLAEYSGLIFSIGAWVMDQACGFYRQLESSGFDEIRMAVNVSMPQFQRPEFPDDVAHCLSRHSIPPEFLELEITESIAMNEPDIVINRLSALKKLGITIAIDDFGTGYSSLSQLQSLDIDYLKIDRAFVIEIKDGKEGIFTETIVEFCKKLGVHSIAEGVETPEQAGFLRSLGCDVVQGYLYGRPMPPDKLIQWLKTRNADKPMEN